MVDVSVVTLWVWTAVKMVLVEVAVVRVAVVVDTTRVWIEVPDDFVSV